MITATGTAVMGETVSILDLSYTVVIEGQNVEITLQSAIVLISAAVGIGGLIVSIIRLRRG